LLLLSLLAGWKFLTPKLVAEKGRLRVASKEIPAHGALVYGEARIALLREEGRIYALSLVCTHLGCTVNVTPGNLVCPCHGSVFDRHGLVLQGPADRPLRRLPVVEDGEFVEVPMES
jgi:cytochrome b6-f complex iron-sulfur subunit